MSYQYLFSNDSDTFFYIAQAMNSKTMRIEVILSQIITKIQKSGDQQTNKHYTGRHNTLLDNTTDYTRLYTIILLLYTTMAKARAWMCM